MSQGSDDRPAWVSPIIHTGMVMTIGGVIIAQFVQSGQAEAVLIGIAVFGIALSMAPFWGRTRDGDWRSWSKTDMQLELADQQTGHPEKTSQECFADDRDCEGPQDG